MKIEVVQDFKYVEIALAGSKLVDKLQDTDIQGTGYWHVLKGKFIDHILGKTYDNIELPALGFNLSFYRAEDLIKAGVQPSRVLGFEPQFFFRTNEKLREDDLEFVNQIKLEVSREYCFYNYDDPNSLVVPARLYGSGELVEIFNFKSDTAEG